MNIINMHTDGTIGRAVAAYTGARVVELEVVPDPRMPGVFAVQALVKDAGLGVPYTVQFLITETPLQNVGADDLSEVEFTQWPPNYRA